jgi:thiol-disulfide isomerase/thioredoxin
MKFLKKLLLISGVLLLTIGVSVCTKQNASFNTKLANNSLPETGGTPTNPKTVSEDLPDSSINSNAETSKMPKPNYPQIPQKILDSELKALDGKPFKLSDYKDKVLLVNFWATWCGPCRIEMPELVKLSQEYEEKGLVVIGLNADEEEVDEIEQFTKEADATYKMGWGNSELFNYFGVSGLPSSYIIGRDGKMLGIFRGYNPQRTPPKLRQTIEMAISRES